MSAIETLIRKMVTPAIQGVAAFNAARKAPKGPHPYLTGVHTPLKDEFTLDELEVSGHIPQELDGRYIRIGPNPVTPPNPATYHWFLGDGMVHGVKLKGGKAEWYRNRWIRSQSVSKALGEEAKPGPRAMLGDTVNTNVLGHAGDTWAIVEAGGIPVKLTEDLETVAHDPFGGTLNHSFSAHPHTDPDTGEMHAICYSAMDQNTIWHVVVDTEGKVRREEPITVQHGPSIHDCMITENYVIILDLPVTFSMKRLLGGYGFPYGWNEDHEARVGLLPKDGTQDDIVWCSIDPCYVFHPANAYETKDGCVIMDVCAHDSMFAESTQGPDSNSVPFERWTITPKDNSVTRKVVDPDPQEFPRPDERFMGKPYTYAWCVALGDTENLQTNYLLKHNLVTGSREVHDFGANHLPSEFVFVPRSEDAPEGDGWMIGYVLNAEADTTDLVIIDAQNFTDPPVAIVHIPHRIPPGFHGNWVPAPAA